MYVHVCVAGLTHAFALLGQNHPPGSCGQSPHFMIHCRNALILLISVVFTTYNPIHPPGLPIVYSDVGHSSHHKNCFCAGSHPNIFFFGLAIAQKPGPFWQLDQRPPANLNWARQLAH